MKPKLKSILAGAFALVLPQFAHSAEKVSFNRDIRPILSDICFTCHGPDEKQRKGGLRLDIKEAAMKGGESGPAIVPGKPEQSEVYKRLVTHDADDFMPPKKTNKVLTPEQIDSFRRWIAEGAEYQGHWAFIKPTRSLLPAVDDRRWARNEIDYFILARLEKEHLSHSVEADRAPLIRRLTLDLTGLPPAPGESAHLILKMSFYAMLCFAAFLILTLSQKNATVLVENTKIFDASVLNCLWMGLARLP